ncbi:DNA polymerase I, partial [termite gut metagenome]
RAYYAFIKTPRLNSKGFNTSAILGFVNTLEDILKKETPTHIGVAFDPPTPTFRHELYEKYKAQREETPEVIRLSVPLIKKIITAYHIPILEINGYEADDVIGTLALQAGNQGITTYMMTPDKDYAQLVTNNVFMYRPKYGDKEFEIMGVEEIKVKFDIRLPRQIIDLLGLMGDVSDNIPGCPGVGEKTAKKLIAEFDTIDNLLKHTNELKGSLKIKVEENRELIILSKFLATIKTDVPIALNMDMLAHKNADEKELLKIFEELEFKNLINRVFNKGRTVTVNDQSNALQGDLFGLSSTENDAIGQNYANTNLIRLSSLDYDYQLIDDENKRRKLLKRLSAVEIFSMDTETTGTNPITAELVGMSFSYTENQAFYIPVPDDKDKALEILNEFRTVFENENILKVGQNIKYDMLVLRNYGIEVKGKLFDTMVAHYVLQPELRHGMDYLAEIYLNYRTIHIDELIGPKGKNQKSMRDLPPEDVYLYACEDADVTLKLKNILEKELEKNKIEPLFYDMEIPLIPVLVYMESNGVRLELETLKESSVLFNERLKNIEQEIYQSAGESFNIASPKQVGEILFDKLKIMEKAKKTKTGQYTTSEEVLESLRYKHPVIQKILEHRGLKKLLNTYVDALPQLINPRTGKVHTSFNQTVTATGRLSSSNPNLQNIPIRDEDGKEMRKAFIPDDGCLFFSADYS